MPNKKKKAKPPETSEPWEATKCPRCGGSTSQELLICPQCRNLCCIEACIAGVGVICFQCEEAAEIETETETERDRDEDDPTDAPGRPPFDMERKDSE